VSAILKPVLKRAACATLFLLALLTCVQAQSQERVVEVYKRAQPGETAALQIVEIRVAGNPVTIDTPFMADDDWLKNLVVRVRNVSGKTINILPISFGLSDALNEKGRDAAFTIMRGLYGDGYETRDGADERKPILPGEELEFAFTEKQLSIMREITSQRGFRPSRIKFSPVTFVTFEDGSRVQTGFSYSK
jgi:hypothetical protein